MRATITAKPIYQLWITLAQLAILQQGSRLHYDHKCQQASQLGGFLYGWANCAPFDLAEGGEFHVTFENAELQTCLKILEMPANPNPATRALQFNLSLLARKGEEATARVETSLLT